MKRTNPVERCIQYALSLKNGLKMETVFAWNRKTDPGRIQKVNNNNNNDNNNNNNNNNNNRTYLTRVKHIDYVEYEVDMKLNTKKRNALL